MPSIALPPTPPSSAVAPSESSPAASGLDAFFDDEHAETIAAAITSASPRREADVMRKARAMQGPAAAPTALPKSAADPRAPRGDPRSRAGASTLGVSPAGLHLGRPHPAPRARG